MKAQKVTLEIKMEALSIDVLRGMLEQVITNIENEAESGELAMQDGDVVKWTTVRKSVEF